MNRRTDRRYFYIRLMLYFVQEFQKLNKKKLPRVTRISSFLKLVVHKVSNGVVLLYLCQSFGFV